MISKDSTYLPKPNIFKINFLKLIGGGFLNYFPNNEEEISLIRFIALYQYLHVTDAMYFFKTNRYYKIRVKNLLDKGIIRKIKLNLVLTELGIDYSKLCKFEYNKLNRNKKYADRLMRLSRIAAFYHNCNSVKFTASFSIKDKEIFTTTGRRFIGIFDINGIEYLTYQICKEHDSRYITSVIYDIQKERKFKNIIVFTNDITRININDFTFGKNQVIIIEDTLQNKEKLKYLNSINYDKVINNYFKGNVIISEYSFCDYTNHKDKYISTFYFIDTEKINRIKNFLRENKNKSAIIICNKDIEDELKKYLPNAKYIAIDFKPYIDKERIYYD